jgi:hypothetical protein
MDFVQALDPSKLVLGGVVSFFIIHPFRRFQRSSWQALSFFLSLFSSPSYNLPIYLFGAYAQEQTEAIQSLQIVRRFIIH